MITSRLHDSAGFHEAFSSDEQLRLQAEDSQAWRNVTGILVAVVLFGVSLGVATVTLIALTS